jgi:hypothetical protein
MEVVVNRCYGGFGLSHKAMVRYFEIKGWKLVVTEKNHKTYKEEEVDVNSITDNFFKNAYYKDSKSKNNFFSCHDIDRSDPDLVQVVKELGKEANARYAQLEIVEIPDDVNWTIEEYDGNEHVGEVHRIW